MFVACGDELENQEFNDQVTLRGNNPNVPANCCDYTYHILSKKTIGNECCEYQIEIINFGDCTIIVGGIGSAPPSESRTYTVTVCENRDYSVYGESATQGIPCGTISLKADCTSTGTPEECTCLDINPMVSPPTHTEDGCCTTDIIIPNPKECDYIIYWQDGILGQQDPIEVNGEIQNLTINSCDNSIGSFAIFMNDQLCSHREITCDGCQCSLAVTQAANDPCVLWACPQFPCINIETYTWTHLETGNQTIVQATLGNDCGRLQISSNGTYTVEATDADGCPVTSWITVTNADLCAAPCNCEVLIHEDDCNISAAHTLSCAQGGNWNWTLDGDPIGSPIGNPVTEDGEYCAEYIDLNGCTAIQCVPVNGCSEPSCCASHRNCICAPYDEMGEFIGLSKTLINGIWNFNVLSQVPDGYCPYNSDQVTMVVHDVIGQFISQTIFLYPEAGAVADSSGNPSNTGVFWNGVDAGGNPVPTALYFLTLTFINNCDEHTIVVPVFVTS